MFESQWRQHIFSLLLKVYTEPVPTELHIQWVPVFDFRRREVSHSPFSRTYLKNEQMND
jgi:hypothetical protein